MFSGHVHAYERLYVDGVTYVGPGAMAGSPDCSGAAWTGELSVLPQGPLRFGTSATGLSASQLARIRFPSDPTARASRDASGYLEMTG